MRKIATIAGLVLATTALGGCQAIFGSDQAEADLQDLDMSGYFDQRLAMGKAHLDAGRPTKAIVAFRQASYDPRVAGEAYNGMAIAYDQLGRADLAARYFEAAVAAAPEDARFARNLARLEGRPTVPQFAPEDLQVEMAVNDPGFEVRGPVTIASPPTQLSGPVSVEKAPEVRVARTSQGQVALAAAPAAPLVKTTTPVRTAEKLGGNRHVKVEPKMSAARLTSLRARRGAQARKAYPIRIVLNTAAAQDRR